ncbi:MAG TPA: DUF885 domain-containing protein [Gemmatimonadota bacterium]|nr:DUF885 domain-containing protein [Gemmatimonadota bacterium]
MRTALATAAWLLVMAGTAAAQAPPDAFDGEFEALASDPALGDAERLHRLIDVDWRRSMAWYPEWATYVGWESAENDAWTDMSLAAVEARQARAGAALPVLDAIDREALSPDDQLNYDLFRLNVEWDVEGGSFPDHLMPLNQMGGVQQDAASLLAIMPTNTVADYEAIVARLGRLPGLIDQTVQLMERGLVGGLTPPRITLRDVPDQVVAQIVDDPSESPMLQAFGDFPEAVPEAERVRLRAAASAAYEEGIVPALHRLHRFLVGEYLPAARDEIGLAALPEGEAWYAFRARRSTTTDMSPAEIHATGLSEVERIRGEMERVIDETGFEGTFGEFLEHLRTDPRFFHQDAEALLAGYRDIAKRADPELPRLFGTLPRLPYGVKAIPAYAEKSQTTAYYQPGSPEVGRPGWYFANTYALETRPIWEMEALTLHEAVPGHHLQIAIAQELPEVPEFRRHGGYTAFVEGWGLYAESLGEEMGFYEDPYSKFGQLTYEMWRAVRLVVDTGMHSMEWDRQRAIDFFAANSSKSIHDITVEIDRYIVWPGQALAYKVGELKIKELRALATAELGEAFDVRGFHDVVLGAGAVPLSVLEARVRAWIEQEKGAAPAPGIRPDRG